VNRRDLSIAIMARIPISGFVVCRPMGLLKQLFFFAAERSYRFVWLCNLWRFSWSSWRFLKSRRRVEAYRIVRGRIGSGRTDTYNNDHGLNFFARLILENRYAFVIELGSYTADRSIKLSKLFPQTKFYALDITDDFSSERILNGVTLGPNNLQNITVIAARHPRVRWRPRYYPGRWCRRSPCRRYRPSFARRTGPAGPARKRCFARRAQIGLGRSPAG